LWFRRSQISCFLAFPAFFVSCFPFAMSRDTALVFFARLPVPGKAKTRLARDVGPELAAEFYRRMAERSFAATSTSKRTCSRTLCFSDACDADGVARWVTEFGDDSLRVAPQCDTPDLGERMRHALNCALSTGGVDGGRCEKAIVVGTDVPDLKSAHIDAAARALDEHDVVFGPAVDGGYYLVGVRRGAAGFKTSAGSIFRDDTTQQTTEELPSSLDGKRGIHEAREPPSVGVAHHALFKDIKWSTPTVLRDSLVAAKSAGLMPAHENTLPTLRDVDTLEDVAAWGLNAERAPGSGSEVDGDFESFREAANALIAASITGGYES
jgi:rSAM/selenodomain-associated transferase 1